MKRAQIGTIDAQIKRNQASLDTGENQPRLHANRCANGRGSDADNHPARPDGHRRAAPNILTLADMSTMLGKPRYPK